MTAIDEKVSIPETEKFEINRMADKFKGAMEKIAEPAKSIAAVPTEKPPAAPEEPKPAEAPKPVEKPPEPVIPKEKSPARQQFEDLEKLKDKFKTDYETLKSQYDPIVSERDQLKTKLDEAVKGTQEYEQARQRLAEQEKIIKQIAIEHDPQFQAHFSQRVSNAILEAKEAVGPEHSAKIEAILQLPASSLRDREIEAIAETLTSEFAKMDLLASVKELKRTERDRKAELAKAPENYKLLQEVRDKEAREQREKALATRSQLVEHITKQIEPDLTDVDADTAKAIKEDVRKMVHNEMDAEKYVGFLIYGAKGRKAESLLKAKDEKIATLEAQITELQGSQPTAPRNGRAAPAVKEGEFEDVGAKFKRLVATIPAGKK